MEDNDNKIFAGQNNETEEAGLSLTDLLRAMRVHWLWFVISIIICIGLGGLYLLRATPMFTRSTEILLKDDSSQSLTTDLSMLGINSVPSELLNEMFIMASPEIMEEAVIKLGLNEVYKYPKILRKAQYYNNAPVIVGAIDSLTNRTLGYSFRIELNADSSSFSLDKFKVAGKKVSGEAKGRFNEPVETPVGTFIICPTDFYAKPVEKIGAQNEIYYSYSPVKVCARDYCKKLQTAYDEERGNIVTLTIALPTAKQAVDVLNAIVDAYNNRWVADKNQIAMATSSFIDERLAAIEKELGDVESNITAYKSTHRMLDMEAMANIYLAQSTENQKALNELAQEIAIGKYIKQELAVNDITRFLPSTAAIAGTDIQQMIAAYNTQVGERNAKLQSLPEESPLIRQKTEAIANTRAAIIASVDAALATLNKRYEAITSIDQKTQAQLASAPRQAEYLMSEERNRKVKEELYVYLLQRREEIELNQAFTVYNTRMVTEPYGNPTPTSPNTKMILMLAIVMGAIIPTLIIYVKEISNTKVRSRKDIEDLPIPFLGEVPMANVPQHRRFPLGAIRPYSPNPERKIIVSEKTNDIINEAFRMIRTNIDFMGAMDHRKDLGHGKTLMTVSLNAGSGKTFVSLNTGAIFAVKGKKVCLVDMDLRKGTVSLNVGNPAKGLTDYLIGKTDDINSLIHHNVNGIEGFDILPEGMTPPNPTELLYSPRLEELIERLRNIYDYVIFDCPPIEIVADARLLNPYIDMTIFVMRSGLFEKSDIKVLNQIFSSRRYNNMALVLNATDSLHGVYGSYGYGYHYGAKRRRR